MMSDIKGLLIDLDGVIYNDSVLIKGAIESIQWLRDHQIPYRYITNTTMKSRATLKKKLAAFGIPSERDEIFSSLVAAVRYIQKSGKSKCHLLMTEDAKTEFSAFELDSDKPDFVVVGDLGESLSFELLNTAFQKLFTGAQLLALQKNRFWLSDRGYTMDTGAVVAMLEYASGKKSQIMGKPSPHFFALALDDMQLPPENVVMIGDDIETDINGAQRMGIRAVLVKSGKYRPQDEKKLNKPPWKQLDSIAQLSEIFNKV